MNFNHRPYALIAVEMKDRKPKDILHTEWVLFRILLIEKNKLPRGNSQLDYADISSVCHGPAGQGLSEKPSKGYALEYHLQDIKCLLDDLDIDRVAIMGHSLGAFIGLAFAAEYPERVERLILRATVGLLSLDDILLPEEVIERMIVEIPLAQRFDVSGMNHYGIVFQPHKDRDQATRDFLDES